MRSTAGRHFCLLLLLVRLSWAEDTKRDPRKTHNVTVWGQAKARRLFARQNISPIEHPHIPKHRSHLIAPARRCGRLMENCSSHMPCCDPCASCRCRLFNTICHCWRMNPLCLRRT
ncbi:agouti-signaling protein 2b isoform X2 [Cyprinodon tularosa]|nr:agouti-signaling protein 2b isoform X2 [Cyprinodon tularosa]